MTYFDSDPFHPRNPRLLFSDCCDHLELDRDRRRQRKNFNRRARWIGFALAREMFGVEVVVDRKILFHVREEDRNVDNVVPACAGVFQDEPDILKHGTALRFDVVARDIAGGIERHARDFFAAARARSDSGKKQKITDTLCVRERTHWFRRPGAFERLAHINAGGFSLLVRRKLSVNKDQPHELEHAGEELDRDGSEEWPKPANWRHIIKL